MASKPGISERPTEAFLVEWLDALGNWKKLGLFMARRAIPMIAFPRVRTIYIYIYIYIFIFNRPLTRVCVVYVVKEVT